ncbi:MAG: RraA family protein, partial [Deltaproteobacteria bacterium]|nr:RraA family protein [Deltaproteobacteria bacterium]
SFELNYPIFSRARYMRTGKDRVQVDGMNVPVSMGEIQVQPGDVVLGSDDGVVVVPKDREQEILALAQSVSEAEDRILKAAMLGMRLDEARKLHRYHELQRKG